MKRLGFVVAALAGALIVPSFARGDAGAVPSADIAVSGLHLVDFPRWQELAPNVYAYEGMHPPGPAGGAINTVSLIIVTTDGVMVVDGQNDVWQTKLMIESIKKLTSQPIKYVVVASDHPDHVGGNAAFAAAYPDAVFISSPASQKKLADSDTPPTETVADERTIRMGGTEIQLLYLGRAHTGGDLAAYLPESKVMFLGEIYLRGVFPAMRSGYPSEWLGVIEKAQAMDVSWYVPGHGFIADDAATMERDLEESRKAIVYVIEEVERLHAKGLPCESPRNCPAAEHADWGPYGDWALSSSQGPLAVAKIYEEIEGKL